MGRAREIECRDRLLWHRAVPWLVAAALLMLIASTGAAAETLNTASPDTVRAMTPEMFFDYLGVRLNSAKTGDAEVALNCDFGASGGQYLVELENGGLNHTADLRAENADATVTLTRDTLNGIILQQTKLADAISSGAVKIDGDQAKLEEVTSYLDDFEFWFNIVTPNATN